VIETRTGTERETGTGNEIGIGIGIETAIGTETETETGRERETLGANVVSLSFIVNAARAVRQGVIERVGTAALVDAARSSIKLRHSKSEADEAVAKRKRSIVYTAHRTHGIGQILHIRYKPRQQVAVCISGGLPTMSFKRTTMWLLVRGNYNIIMKNVSLLINWPCIAAR
jgi:hypothetical protein